MFGFISNLRIGTKVVAVVVTMILALVIGASTVCMIKSKQILSEEAEKLLKTASGRYANFISSIITEGFISVNTVQGVVNAVFKNTIAPKEQELISVVDSMVDSNPNLILGYIYINDPQNVNLMENSRSLTDRGEVLMIIEDDDVSGKGGTKQIAPDYTILKTQAFDDAMNGNKVAFGHPKRMVVHGRNVYAVNIIAPIYNANNKKIGVVGIMIDLALVSERLVDRNKAFDTEIRMLLTDNGIIVSHTNPNAVNKVLAEYNTSPQTKQVVDALRAKRNGIFEYHSLENDALSLSALHNFSIPYVNRSWAVLTLVPYETIEEPLYNMMNYIGLTCFIFLMLSIIVVLLYVRVGITNRINALQGFLSDFFAFLRHEKHDVKDYKILAQDELGQMAQDIKNNIALIQDGAKQDKVVVEDTVGVVKKIENGDFSVSVTNVASNPELVKLTSSLNNMLNVLRQKVGSNMNEISRVFDSYKNLDFTTSVENARGDVETMTNVLGNEIKLMLDTSSKFANALTHQSSELQSSMDSLIESSNAQANSLQRSASAIEEITASMQNVSEKTNQLTAQSEDIKSVIEIIRDIADQTNLLALNAAIEAARAGEHGRGFAVVADEVRKLAERTQKSLGEIEANVNLLVQSVNDMSSSIKEQTAGVAQINEVVASLEGITQDNVSIANRTSVITEDVSHIAQEIFDDVHKKKF